MSQYVASAIPHTVLMYKDEENTSKDKTNTLTKYYILL
jgi:hypothetical protein